MITEGKEHVVRIINLAGVPQDAAAVAARAAALQAGPHDILLVGREVWCFVKGVAFKHPAHHDHDGKMAPAFQEAMLIVKPGESVKWECAQPTEISLTPVEPPDRPVVPHRPTGWSPEPQPFANPTPYLGISVDEPARSGVVKKSAENTQYKVTVRINSVNYDPDIFCGSGN